jgi:conjugal transfer mating pair stabilization protein TraN
VYRCPTPSSTVGGDKQYICGDDVYCINGDCEPIVREASTEFRDALVGLHALDQAGKEFNEADFKVFTGTRETCHKPVFGLINCCAGKVSGLVPLGAGAAALAGGPAAIAAFATPLLVLFACSQDEMKLDIKDRMGLCHNLGSYCSSSFLGICSTKRTAYCCFESKLSRVLQEQGRPQLGKPWGSAKKEQCQGFTVDEFARLDLSVMDFTDVYSDFMDAAKLPDEVQTMSDIQDKIQAYYDLHGK